MMQRKYFEIYASAGRPSAPNKDYPYEVDILLKDMEYARIHGSAVMHNAAKDYSFEYGNREAILMTKSNPRLFPLATVPETACHETGNADYYSDLIKNGVCAFVALGNTRIAPSLKPKNMSEMAEALIKHSRPLIVADVNCEERYDRVAALAEAFPELSIIMQGTSWSLYRSFCKVMEQCENVCFEMTSNHTNTILELTKEHFGIERALYSSAWPIKSMGAMKSMIEYADISEEDKNLVSHLNACRLMGINPELLKLYDEEKCQLDFIAREADAGKPLSVPVIDAHSHIGEKGNSFNTNPIFSSDPDSMVKKMDRLGIDTAITAPLIGVCYDGIAGNDEVLAAQKQYPGRFLGFSTCNVNYKEDLEKVIHYHIDYPDTFVGVKPYPPFHKFLLTDDVCKDWFTFANEHHLPILIHSGSSYSQQTDEIAPLYPNATFILAHSGSSYDMARYNSQIANKHPNVVLDITYTTTGRGMVEFLVEQVGADKVIYGSDMPVRDPAPQLGWVCYAQISESDKKKILYENIKRIMEKRI